MPTSYYSIVRYLPDPIKEEHLNIGVVVVNESVGYAGCRFSSDWTRARRFGDGAHISFLREFADSFQREVRQRPNLFVERHFPAHDLEGLSNEWRNAIQFSDLRASVAVDPPRLLSQLFDQYVGPEHEAKHRPRDKRTAVSLAVDALRAAFTQRFNGNTPAFERKGKIQGQHTWHEYDLVLQTDKPVLGIEGFSFEIPESDVLKREIDATAWAITDVKQAKPDLIVGVVALPPHGQRADYRDAVAMYRELGADVVPTNELDGWAQRKAGELAAAF